MANKRITELNLHTSPELSDVIPIVNSNETKKLAYGSIYNDIRDGLVSGSSQITIGDTNGFTSYSSSVDTNIVELFTTASNHESRIDIIEQTYATTGSNSFIGNQTITGSILMTGSISEVDYIDFNTSSLAPGTPGRLQWNDVDGTLDLTLKRGNVTLQIGQETHLHAYNATTSSLLESEHKAVYVSSSISNFPAVELANNLSRIGSENTIGIVTETIPPGETGYITTQGLVRNIDMSAYQAGDTLYLGSSDGVIINQPPLPPALTVILGYCIDNSTSGSMYVNVRSGFEYPQYAVAYNTVDHSASLANTEELLDLTNPAVLSGISLENQTKFIVSTPGLYEFIVTSQIERVASSGTAQVYFWAKKNGTNIDNTGTQVAMIGNANTSATVVTKNIVLVLEANDYVEFAWATTDTDIHLKTFPAASNPTRPLAPAIKITANRIS